MGIMDSVTFLKHSKRVKLGSGYVKLEYEKQFGPKAPIGCYGLKKGKGHLCPFCGIGFYGKKEGKLKCPNCEKEFKA